MASNSVGHSVGQTFQLLFRYTLIGGLIGAVFLAIQSVIENFTALETGIVVVDAIIQNGLVLLVAILMVFGVIEVLVPKAKQFLGF
jgi:hypothetical protein